MPPKVLLLDNNKERVNNILSSLSLLGYPFYNNPVLIPPDYDISFVAVNHPMRHTASDNKPKITLANKFYNALKFALNTSATGIITGKYTFPEVIIRALNFLLTKSASPLDEIYNILGHLDTITKVKVYKMDDSIPISQEIASTFVNSGLKHPSMTLITLSITEVINNAIIHGHTTPEVIFGKINDIFVVSIKDDAGLLTASKVFKNIYMAEKQDKLAAKIALTSSKDLKLVEKLKSSGRGLNITRKIANELYISVIPNTMTNVIILFNNKYHKRDYDNLIIFKSYETTTLNNSF